MMPEERVNEYYWWVLSKIKEKMLTTLKDKPVLFKYSHVAAAGVPNNETEQNILAKLEEEGALRIRDNPFLAPIPRDNEIYLDIIQSKFNEVFQRYKELSDPSPIKKQDTSKQQEPKLRTLATTSNYTNIPAKIAITDLQSKYQEIEAEKDPIQFFMGAAHYGQYILENAATMYVLEPLYKEAENDAKPYLQAWQDFYNIWKVYAEDILRHAETIGLKDDSPTSNEIADIKNKLQTIETSLFESGIGGYFRSYWWLVKRFNDVGKSSMLMPKHFESNESEFTISPSYHKASDEWTKFEHSRELKVWWAHYQICRLASAVLDLNERENYFNDDNAIESFYKYEFDELAKGNLSRTPIVLHENKYRIWIKRLHEYLLPRLQNVDMNLVIATFRKKMYLEDEQKTIEETSWSDKFKWINETDFYLDDNNKISFGAKSSDRKTVFQMLTDAKGAWVKVSEMASKISKTHGRTRTILSQINEDKLKKSGHILIVPKSDTNEPGAYRIKLISQN